MTRKRFTEREVLETLAWQGVFVCCWRCGKPFFELVLEPTPMPNVYTDTIVMRLKPEREHVHEYALGGADRPFNARYGCAPCHSIATNGTKATSAGSSKQRIAKVRRILADKPSERPMQNSGKKMPKRADPWNKQFRQAIGSGGMK